MPLEQSADRPQWESISQDEVKKWRRDLPKGHVREYDTAHTTGLPVADSEGDAATMERSGPPVIDDPRAVVNDLRNIAIGWATESRQNAQLAVKLMRASNPEAFRHRSDDELIAMITGHYEKKIQEVTEKVYRDPQNRWDKGNLVDVKDGVWRP